MRKQVLACLLALMVAAPAHATGGLFCRTSGANPVELSVVVSHTVVASVVTARLRDKGIRVPVAVAQSWLDPGEFRIDLMDPNATRHELRLRARLKGDAYAGSIWRGGQRRSVRCREG